jgi:hypothetical protein
MKPAASVFEWAGECAVNAEKVPYQRFVIQRSHKGTNNENARLTPEQVREICRRYDALRHMPDRAHGRYGQVQQIADEFGITRQWVRKLAKGLGNTSVTQRAPAAKQATQQGGVDWAELKRLARRSRKEGAPSVPTPPTQEHMP